MVSAFGSGLGRRGKRALGAVVAAAALTAVVALPAHAESAPTPWAFTNAETLLPTVQGGALLGVPPLPELAAGNAETYGNPDFWANWVHTLMNEQKALLPLPTDVVKPDVLLPHARIVNGPEVSPMPTEPVDLRGITYEWAGQTRTVEQFQRNSLSDALLFMHNGKLVSETYANGWSDGLQHQAWSTTKSFVSTAVGVAIDEGRIASVDDPIERYVPELAETAWRGTTIRNLLEMRSGIKWNEDTTSLADNNQFQEWVNLSLDYYSGGQLGKTRNAFIKELPRESDQGVKFNYNSANPQVLAWMLENVYGQSFAQVLSEKVWVPAGMEGDANIMTDRLGGAVASEELFAHPRDFARFGELMRNGGVASNGHRVVSAQWVADATTNLRGPVEDSGDIAPTAYGYLWWGGATPGGFQADGFQGQYVTVDPGQCLTGVRLAHTIELDPTTGDFAGQENPEWHAVYRAVADRLGGC